MESIAQSVSRDKRIYACYASLMLIIPPLCHQFTDYYYTTFDQNRAGLGPLYVSASARH